MKKTIPSFLILALFIWGIGFYGNGLRPFTPSLRLLQDSQWDFSLFWKLGAEKLLALVILIPIGLGFLGWSFLLKDVFFREIEKRVALALGFLISVSLFSAYVFGLAINQVFYGPLTFLFFVPAIGKGWLERNEFLVFGERFWNNKRKLLLAIPLALWLAEYFSPPVIWDAVLDHFRYAREVSRLHQILLHWTNHTGDMPKAAELVLAGFWNMGGESLSKLSASLAVLGAVCLLDVFSSEWKGGSLELNWIFWTCPFFLAIFSWGYVEGFLAIYEILTLYCLWKALTHSAKKRWNAMAAYSLGFALAIKYTALLAVAAFVLVWLYGKTVRKMGLKLDWTSAVFFIIPLFPWLLKNWEAYHNPLYPLATSIFGTPYGYGPGMEQELLHDTGLPQGFGLVDWLALYFKVFFTSENAVAACWTPLVFMSLPWCWKIVRSKLGFFMALFVVIYFTGWAFLCTSLRHASGGTLCLVLLTGMAWNEAFKDRKNQARLAFGAGILVSLWLCLSAQLTTTAPYASALGLEDPLLRLKRHYSYDTDTYSAYRFIEDHSDSRDRIIAFGVFQTYPLRRSAFVDFKWKRPIFLQWASQCQTAEELARKLHEEGVRFFLYQQWEAQAMSRAEKDFYLENMPIQEYVRFWQYYMEPVEAGENTCVYRALTSPSKKPRHLEQLPGVQEKGHWRPE